MSFLRSALKSPLSRPNSPSLTSETTTFRISSPISDEPSPITVPTDAHSISSLLASTSSQSHFPTNVDANAPSQSPSRNQHHTSPVPTYTPKVSFDTFENSAASMFSF